MSTILDTIIAKKHEELAAAKRVRPIEQLEALAAAAAAPLDFHAALAATDEVRLIAEVKKASPSAGIIREDFDPVAIATTYANSGAACISVLTDESFFQGNLEFLRQIRAAVQIPLLRKDFIIDRYQLLEARAAGADCVLLIAECLSAEQLITLHRQAGELGLQTLIEFYDDENLPAVLATEGRLIGVNNRDLRTFHTDLGHTIRMRSQIPADRLLVGESGIRTNEDVKSLGAAGVKAILVGESLMRQSDIGQAVRTLLGKS
ncbi:Indole-3-glycerol phosphate synthase [Rosistilla ulvae]|uniref:Indole-3-glycerol phosphate synthase n=1 Tax=Rosistilla ulvae TaxID=1930277 RepID=A0A517M358_9BACT|nr:indole-3-glycerol phosphate synthase TrpC [Rosistilla ulvae]QDS89289.1 Indole-3-glycerol phosphate synthase [Rosistilla ulvae]